MFWSLWGWNKSVMFMSTWSLCQPVLHNYYENKMKFNVLIVMSTSYLCPPVLRSQCRGFNLSVMFMLTWSLCPPELRSQGRGWKYGVMKINITLFLCSCQSDVYVYPKYKVNVETKNIVLSVMSITTQSRQTE